MDYHPLHSLKHLNFMLHRASKEGPYPEARDTKSYLSAVERARDVQRLQDKLMALQTTAGVSSAEIARVSKELEAAKAGTISN